MRMAVAVLRMPWEGLRPDAATLAASREVPEVNSGVLRVAFAAQLAGFAVLVMGFAGLTAGFAVLSVRFAVLLTNYVGELTGRAPFA